MAGNGDGAKEQNETYTTWEPREFWAAFCSDTVVPVLAALPIQRVKRVTVHVEWNDGTRTLIAVGEPEIVEHLPATGA